MDSSNVGARAISVVLRDTFSVQRYFLPQVKGGGIIVETDNLLPLGAKILLLVTLPDTGQRTPVQGKVIWVLPEGNREGHKPAIGVQFLGDRSGVLTRIQNIISELPAMKREILAF